MDSFLTRATCLDKSRFKGSYKRIGSLVKWYSSVAAAKKELAKGWPCERFAVGLRGEGLERTRRRDEAGWLAD